MTVLFEYGGIYYDAGEATHLLRPDKKPATMLNNQPPYTVCLHAPFNAPIVCLCIQDSRWQQAASMFIHEGSTVIP